MACCGDPLTRDRAESRRRGAQLQVAIEGHSTFIDPADMSDPVKGQAMIEKFFADNATSSTTRTSMWAAG